VHCIEGIYDSYEPLWKLTHTDPGVQILNYPVVLETLKQCHNANTGLPESNTAGTIIVI
jgi:hypothetical protein